MNLCRTFHGLWLTFSELSPKASDLLIGEVPVEWAGRDDILTEFLAGVAVPQIVHNSDSKISEISELEVLHGFKTWPESTSTLLSGRHLGHYKAVKAKTPGSAFMFHKIHEHSSVSRHSSQASDVLIEKDWGTIHLFEADFNFLSNFIWYIG